MAYHGINIRTFYLAYNLTFYLIYLTFFLAYNLTFFLAFYLTFFPAFFLAFYLAFIPAFYLASIPAFILASVLAFIFPGMCSGPGVAQCIRSSRYGLDPLMWRRAGRGGNLKGEEGGKTEEEKEEEEEEKRKRRDPHLTGGDFTNTNCGRALDILSSVVKHGWKILELD